MPALTAAAPQIMRGSSMFIPYLPSQNDDARLAAAQRVRALGFAPMPHLSARRIASRYALQAFVRRAVDEAGVERCLVIAGDAPSAVGPFSDSVSLIETGVFERSGIKAIGVAGHPEGHPSMPASAQWDVLERKCRSIAERGMAPLIVTQFAFDADTVLTWLRRCARVALPIPCMWACRVLRASQCSHAMPHGAVLAHVHRCSPSTASRSASCSGLRGRIALWIASPPASAKRMETSACTSIHSAASHSLSRGLSSTAPATRVHWRTDTRQVSGFAINRRPLVFCGLQVRRIGTPTTCITLCTIYFCRVVCCA